MVQGEEIFSIGAIKRTNYFKDDCDRCKIWKSSGTLQFATGYNYHPVQLNSTIAFVWERSPGLPDPCELTWSKKKDIKKSFLILVDLLPTIALNNRGSEEVEKHTADPSPAPATSDTSLKHRCFLVPKCCKNEHNTCWKVSHCLFEIDLLKSTSEIHRECYMVLKYIFDYLALGMGQVRGEPTTYVLKTAVLQHVQECSDREPQLTRCCREIMQYLSRSHGASHLPHLILQDQNFLVPPSISIGFRFANEHKLWSKNRNHVLSCFWAFLERLFEQFESIVGPQYSFETIAESVEVTSLKFGRAYACTTFKAIHVPDTDAFIHVLSRIARGEDVPLNEFDGTTEVQGDESDNWDRGLALEEYGEAFQLYAQMQYAVPDVVTERMELYVQLKDEARTESEMTVLYRRLPSGNQ